MKGQALRHWPLFFLLLILLSFKVDAALYLQTGLGLHSDNHSNSSVFDLDYSRASPQLYLGAQFFVPWFIVGVDVHNWKRKWNYNIDNEDYRHEVSVMEVGPRAILFLNSKRNFYLSASYRGYLKGDVVDGQSKTTVRGRSVNYGVGLQMPLSRQLFFGLSFNYHNSTLRREISDLQTEEINYSMQGFYPVIEFSYRFNRFFNWGRRSRQSFPRSWIHN